MSHRVMKMSSLNGVVVVTNVTNNDGTLLLLYNPYVLFSANANLRYVLICI